ncbi:MAG: hypothetical protein ACOX60_11150 [Massiliimalia sp.]|jgi:hypothetical protein
MSVIPKTVDFFLGANSENGFVSHFSQLQDPKSEQKLYLLKGGPGTGKSSLMKRLAAQLEQQANEVYTERIHCSSDPDSLDGVMFQNGRCVVLDATRPHPLEPIYAGAMETMVNLLEHVDDAKLEESRQEIVEVSGAISSYHKKFCELLRCANTLLDANRRLILPYVDMEKIRRTAQRIAKREFRIGKNHIPGKEQVRLLSAFTPKGLITYESTVTTLCRNRYFISDEHRVCAPVLLQFLRQELKEREIGYYLCYSPFRPGDEIDHILIPELDLAFLTVNKYEPMSSITPTRSIHAVRFLNQEILRAKKQRLSFYRKTAAEVLQEGIFTLEKAKEAHDALECFYLPCVDFSGIDQLSEMLLNKIKRRYALPAGEQ